MINYYKLSELKKNLEQTKYEQLILNILYTTIPVKEEYPDYKNWFLNKHITNIGNQRDTLIALYNNEIVGVINIKYDEIEKKICTLYIKKGFRFNKVGTTLLNMSFEILETSKPLITIADNKIFEYRKIITKYDWDITQKLDNYYAYDNDEYIFNGAIYIPNPDDRIMKIYSKKNKNIIEITLLHLLYNLENIIYKKKEV